MRWALPARPITMSDRPAALEPLDALVGAWTTEMTHPMFDGVVTGTVTFEWLEGGQFLLQRSRTGQPPFPDSLWVIGAPEDGDGLVAEYFDSRGVRRTYGIATDDGTLRIWRDDPEFAQRFAAPLGRDELRGTWQLAETPGDWKDDLEITYRRAD